MDVVRSSMSKKKETLSLDRYDKLSVQVLSALVESFTTALLCDATDTAMRIAYASTLSEGETFTTLELKINFTKSIWNARLQMIGQAIKQGSTDGWALN